MHVLYIYNKDLTRKLEGMPQEDFLYICPEDFIRKLEGMHLEDPGAFSIYL